MKRMDNMLTRLIEINNRKRVLRRALSVLCAITVLFTANTLKLNADSLEHLPTCGIMEHVHDETCLNEAGEYACGLEEHLHTDACYQERPRAASAETEDAFAEEIGAEELTDVTLGGEDNGEESYAPADAQEEFIEEPVYSLLDRDYITLSEMELPLQLEEVFSVLEVVPEDEAEEDFVPNLRIEQVEQDFIIMPIESFIEREIAIETAEGITLVALTDGLAVSATETELDLVADDDALEDEEAQETAEPLPDAEDGETDAAVVEEAPEAAETELEAEVTEDAGDADAPVEEEPVEEEQTEEETVEEEPVEDKQTEEETIEGESVEDEQTEEASIEEEPVEDEFAEDGQVEAAAAPAQDVARHFVTVDLAEVEQYPLSLKAIMDIEAQEEPADEVEAPAIDEEPINEAEIPAVDEESVNEIEAPPVDVESADEAEIPAVEGETADEDAPVIEVQAAAVDAEGRETTAQLGSGDPAPAALSEADWRIDYDDTLLSVEYTDGDYAIAPIADFDRTELTVDAGDTYVITLLNGSLGALYPAQDFAAATDSVTVSVSAPEGAFPEGTTLSVVDVEDETTIDDIMGTVAEGFVEVERVHAVDISFHDADGAEIEPRVPISVVMTPIEQIDEDRETVVVHVDDVGEVQLVETEDAVEVESATKETVEAAIESAADEGSGVAFIADAFSVYALVVTKKLDTKLIASDGGTYHIEVTYTEDAGIPDGAALAVTEVTEDGSYLVEVERGLAGNKLVTLARFFDIKIMESDAEDAEEVRPLEPVEVRIWLTEGDEAEEAPTEDIPDDVAAAPVEGLVEETIVSIGEETDSESIETMDAPYVEEDDHIIIESEPVACAAHFADDVVIKSASEDADAVVFTAEGFSVWGVVYTVDFYYGNYEYHLEGGEEILLSSLFELLEIGADAADAAEVAFSDDALIRVEQVENDWLLTSLEPFDTEEKLTVTMEDGTVYVVRVEDAQYKVNIRINDIDRGMLAGNYGGTDKIYQSNNLVGLSYSAGSVLDQTIQVYPYQFYDGSNTPGTAVWWITSDGTVLASHKDNTGTNMILDDKFTNISGETTAIAYVRSNDEILVALVGSDTIRGRVTADGPQHYVSNDSSLPTYYFKSEGTKLTAQAYISYNEIFDGWYANGVRVSTDTTFDVSTVTTDTILEPRYTAPYKYTVMVNDSEIGYLTSLAFDGQQTNYTGDSLFRPNDLNLPYIFRDTAANPAENYKYWIRDDGNDPVVMGSSRELRGGAKNFLDRDTTYIAWFAPEGQGVVRYNNTEHGSVATSKAPRAVSGTTNGGFTLPYYYTGEDAGTTLTATPDAGSTFAGWYNNYESPEKMGTMVSTNRVYTITAGTNNLNLTAVFEGPRDYLYVYFDGTNGIRATDGTNRNHTLYASMDGAGTIYEGAQLVMEKVYRNEQGKFIVKLPGRDTTTLPSGQQYTKFQLQGWYQLPYGQPDGRWTDDLYNHYYDPEDTVEITCDTVFYADWFPDNYNIGENVNVLKSGNEVTLPGTDKKLTVSYQSTGSFITTRMYDYNNLFNMESMQLDSDSLVNGISNYDYWSVNTDSRNFLFVSAVSGDVRSLSPRNRKLAFRNQSREISRAGGSYMGIVKPGIMSTTGLKDDLFDTDDENVLGKRYAGEGDYLYLYNPDTGYYFYDSDIAAASFNHDAGRFYVYNYKNATNKSFPDAGGDDEADFLPFNYGSDHTFVETSGEPNYWFGMKSEINFFLPNSTLYTQSTTNDQGQTVTLHGNQAVGGDGKSRDMVFKFSGDDDVWVYVDGTLVLDMGGIHGKVYGEINFSTGETTIAQIGASKIYDTDGIMSYGVNDVTLDQKFVDRDNSIDDDPRINTIEQVTHGTINLAEGDHKVTIYYLERGTSQSNCAIYFNLAPRYALQLYKYDEKDDKPLGGAEFGVFTDEACTIPANVWRTYTGQRTHIFPTGNDGLVHCSGLLAGHTYYIKELTAPEGYPDVSEEVIALAIAADGKATVSSTKDSDTWKMATVSSSEDDPLTKGKFMFRMEVKNNPTTSITAKKIWAMLDGNVESKPDSHSEVKVKLQRYKLTEADSEDDALKYTVQVVSRYFTKDGKPVNRDDGELATIRTDSCVVNRGGSVTFTVQANGEAAGIHSVSGGSITASDVENTTATFFMNGGWSTAMKHGTFTASNIRRNTVIHINYIGSADSVNDLDTSISALNVVDAEGNVTYAKQEDTDFNEDTKVGTQNLEATLKKSNKWTTTWDDLPVTDGGTAYYYYVKEITDSTKFLAEGGTLDLDNTVPAYVATYSSDGLSGGGTITVRNNVNANKIRLRKRDDSKNVLNGAQFQIYLKSEYDNGGNPLTVSGNSQWMDEETYDAVEHAFVSGGKESKGFIYSGYLPVGTYYVVETKAPEGYKPLDGPITVTVDANGMVYKLPGEENFTRAPLGSDGYYSLYIVDPEIVPVDITVAKVIKGTSTPLDGATFTLTRVDADNHDIKEDGAYSETHAVADSGDNKGKTTFEGLTYGRYRLEETVVPDGYIKTEGPYYIDIDAKGVHGLDETVSHSLITKDGNVYTVENEPGFALPSTGGSGTVAYTASGLALILIAAALLLRRRRLNRERGYSEQ